MCNYHRFGVEVCKERRCWGAKSQEGKGLRGKKEEIRVSGERLLWLLLLKLGGEGWINGGGELELGGEEVWCGNIEGSWKKVKFEGKLLKKPAAIWECGASSVVLDGCCCCWWSSSNKGACGFIRIWDFEPIILCSSWSPLLALSRKRYPLGKSLILYLAVSKGRNGYDCMALER